MDVGISQSWADHAKAGRSGLILLDDNREALLVRILAARSAVRTLDLMYYLWHDDRVGRLLAKEVVDAADRGVKVRILLDDLNPRSSDAGYLALDAHPNIELKLFNPSGMRNGHLLRSIEFAARMLSMTRRMHAKAWICDERAAIVGGRNIGDAYFDAADTNFRDLDLLILGTAATQTRSIFEAYWNSKAAWRIRDLNRARPRHPRTAAASEGELDAVGKTDPISLEEFVARAGAVHWTEQARVIADPPEKALGKRRRNWLTKELMPLIRGAERTLNIVSPYFIPGRRGVSILSELTNRGVSVSVLTNSLAATDVAAVHGAYANYRRRLLRRGVRLFEFQLFGHRRDISVFGSKGASLHTKAFTVDERIGFIGSFNFDPRSVSINSEMGVLFQDRDLVRVLKKRLEEEKSPQTSYSLDIHNQRLRWRGVTNGNPVEFRSEPEAGFRRRLLAGLVRYLPIESQL
ncbi:MAG: phospholipase D family protein [Rhizobiaceae bacterium]|nr:phospholipase D family protein [Rhizobiaceae bacterium]